MAQSLKQNIIQGVVMGGALLAVSIAAYKNAKDGCIFDFSNTKTEMGIAPVQPVQDKEQSTIRYQFS